MKKIISFILSSFLLSGFAGCEKYLDVNKNTDAPDQVEDYLYLAGILSSYQGVYYDIRALGPLSQMLGTSSYTNFATNYYSPSSDAAGELWRVNYWLQGMNLENMINQAVEAGHWTLAGIGYAIKAFTWDCLTKYHGEAPMKEAYIPGLLSHHYDYQKEIMAQVRAWAEKAIEYLEMEDNTAYGKNLSANDIAYNGDKAKWIRFAHAIIVSDLAALTNKSDFPSAYAEDLISHAQLAFASNDDNFTVQRGGGGKEAQFSVYNNFWGTFRNNLNNVYWQSDFMVQISTGTVPEYDPASGDKVDTEAVDSLGNPVDPRFPFKLAEKQILCDTSKAAGHYDPRVAVKLSTADGRFYNDMDKADSIKKWVYYGSGFTSASGPIGTAPNLFGFRAANANVDYEGQGRWIFRDDAPYILLTASQVQFDLAEAYWKLGKKAEALSAWKKGVELDVDFTGRYMNPGKPEALTDSTWKAGGAQPGGTMIAKATYDALAQEYLEGPYVGGMSEADFTLSHIMMQKYVAQWPYGALEAWTDLRKYHFDIQYAGDYPSLNNGWTLSEVEQKADTDETKVFKGFYLAPAQVENRRIKYDVRNQGSPAYRVRPRYNSEYMWNQKSLDELKPISGNADNYHTSIPWFAYPGETPESL